MIEDDYEPPLEPREREKRIKDKDLYETVEEVFDHRTLLTIYRLMKKKILSRLNGVVSSGKEARVYLGYDRRGGRLAVKIYYTSTAMFKKGILKYIIGDPRFEGFYPRDTRTLIYTWTRKEYRNLRRMYEEGVSVPRPIACLDNVLVMEWMGEDGRRYPLLSEVYGQLTREELVTIRDQIVRELEKIVCRAGLVHGDLSEYNIMVKPDPSIIIIDVGQAVPLRHPLSIELLRRDISNLRRFFIREAGIDFPDTEELMEGLMECARRKEG
jgi:RIO kinase 1